MRYVSHNRIELALHELRDGAGRPLLLLHGLGERTPRTVTTEAAGWPGPVLGLDFTGHGDSTVPSGGGYSAELLMADVDAVLAQIGPATLLGRGLGAYVALLASGARPQLVRGAVLDDGPGLFGGPTGPASTRVPIPNRIGGGPPDPFALLELSGDVRPPDYAVAYARHAAERSDLDRPLAVAASSRPAWLAAVMDTLMLATTSIPGALAGYSD